MNQYCHQFDGTSQEERNSVQRNTVSFNPTFLLALDLIFLFGCFQDHWLLWLLLDSDLQALFAVKIYEILWRAFGI